MNWSSSKQLRELLFDKLHLPSVEKTPKGEPSTGVKALRAIADKHPIVPLLLEYRKLTKLITSYTESLIDKVSQDGRVHPSFMHTGTETGRLSSASPNGQQIPKHTEEGKKLRCAFVAAPDTFIASFDYSQIELRVLAHYSNDYRLRKAFTDGDDIHTAVAKELGIPRQAAKAVNFGLVYGSTEFGLARTLGIDKDLAKRYINGYFAKYPGVYYWMRRQIAGAHKTGYVETMFGRRRKITGLDSKDKYVRLGAERIALNTTIQGTAAEIMKIAMIKTARLIAGWPCRIILQIHDDLTFECQKSTPDCLLYRIKQELESAVKLSVPLVTNLAKGENLGNQYETSFGSVWSCTRQPVSCVYRGALAGKCAGVCSSRGL